MVNDIISAVTGFNVKRNIYGDPRTVLIGAIRSHVETQHNLRRLVAVRRRGATLLLVRIRRLRHLLADVVLGVPLLNLVRGTRRQKIVAPVF